MTRTTCTLKSSGKVQPVSSYGLRCGSFGRPVLIVEQRVGDAAVRLVHADDVGAGGEGARLRLGAVVPLACLRPGDRCCPSCPSPCPPRPCAVSSFVSRSRGSALARHRDGERRGRARDLARPASAACAAARPARPAADRRRGTRTPPGLRSSASGSSACSSGRSSGGSSCLLSAK